MEGRDSILDAIYEEDNLDDVEMIDIEEGELVEPDSQIVLGQNSAGDINGANQESHRKIEEKEKEEGFRIQCHRHKQVDAIQACGGQKTADDRCFRTGGGILWSIIEVREPKAYKEIMKKAKEFEKQFRQPNVKQLPA